MSGQPSGIPPLRVVVASGAKSPHWVDVLMRHRDCTILSTDSLESLMRRVEGTAPDLVVIDADLAGGVLDTCRRLTARLGPMTPVLVTRAEPFMREQRVALLEAGAWDCLTPPIDARELAIRLDTYVCAKRAGDAAGSAGLADPATGMYNRKGLARCAKEMSAAAFRLQVPVASVVFAFQPARRASGARGAPPGWARAFRQHARTSDIVARLGDDEVAVLAPATDVAGARALARRLLLALDALAGGGSDRVSVQAGCHAEASLGLTPRSAIEIVARAASNARREAPASAATLARALEPAPDHPAPPSSQRL